ncbi:MAG TPA: hypothetical protein VHD90_22335 [Phototrophicaceae bacterium]|nr:hypothetical protein [Phototrophicaceae bacterium]
MSALEQEIYQKFRLLDKDARLRVIARLELEAEVDDTTPEPMSPQEGLAWLINFGEYIQNKYGNLSPSSVDLLNEAREERLDDLMGGG